MKKMMGVVVLLCFAVLLNAQTKVTKTNVVGKWTIAAMEMPGIFSYNLDTDSLFIGEAIKAQVPDPKQLELVKGQFRTQMSMMSKMVFQFNADGTALLVDGMREPQPATYDVDEEKSTITTVEKEGKNEKETLNAEFVDGKLKLRLNSPNGEVVLLMKKAG